MYAFWASDLPTTKTLAYHMLSPPNLVAQNQEGGFQVFTKERRNHFPVEYPIGLLRPKTQHGSNLAIG
jgi:hypothetical protein